MSTPDIRVGDRIAREDVYRIPERFGICLAEAQYGTPIWWDDDNHRWRTEGWPVDDLAALGPKCWPLRVLALPEEPPG